MLQTKRPWGFFWPQRQEVPLLAQEYLVRPSPDKRLSWRDLTFAVVDIETSGLNAKQDAILAIGLVKIHAGRIQAGQNWYSLVRPPEDVLVGADSIRIHGLLRAELAQAPKAAEVLQKLLLQLRDCVLLVHVAAIDVEFLNRALKHHFGIKLRGPALDTARLAHNLNEREFFLQGEGVEKAPNFNLKTLSQRAGLPTFAQHHALSDALTTAQLFLAQASRLERQGSGTLAKLLQAGGCLK